MIFKRYAPLLLAFVFMVATAAPATLRVVYPRAESDQDSRYQYDWEVLRVALEKTRAGFGPFDMQQSVQRMSRARVVTEAANSGSISLFVRATSRELEKQFRPIRIPVDRGLLGYRLLLVRRADLALFADVENFEQLRKFSIGQGKGWIDVDILGAAGLNVVEGSNYEGLFSMLALKRFDAFSRSVDEALREYDERHEHFDFEIEPRLMLYYPLPRYFFTRRNAEGEALAQRLEAGLEIMVRDGTLQALFMEFKGDLIKRSGLTQRRLFHIPNPTLSPETPLERGELWYKPPVRAP